MTKWQLDILSLQSGSFSTPETYYVMQRANRLFILSYQRSPRECYCRMFTWQKYNIYLLNYLYPLNFTKLPFYHLIFRARLGFARPCEGFRAHADRPCRDNRCISSAVLDDLPPGSELDEILATGRPDSDIGPRASGYLCRKIANTANRTRRVEPFYERIRPSIRLTSNTIQV